MHHEQPDTGGRQASIDLDLQRQLLSLVCGLAVLLGCFYSAYFASVGLIAATPIGLACLTISGLAIGLQRRTNRPDVGLDLGLMLLFVLLALMAVLQDGVRSPALWWLAVLPVVAMLGCRRLLGSLLCALFVAHVLLLRQHGGGSWSAVSLLTSDPGGQLTLAMTLSMLSVGCFVAFTSHSNRKRRLAMDRDRSVALSESAAKTRFVSVLSHEIRTPLQALIGATELLQQRYPSAVRNDDLVAAQRESAGTLMALVGNVLDFSKLEAGKLELDAERPVQVGSLLAEVRALFAPQAAAKGIALTATVSPDIPDTLLGDGLRIRQVLMNLVANAVKFTASGGVHLHLGLDGRPAGAVSAVGDRVNLRIAVSDSGVGIDPDAVESLFRPFQQGDQSISRRFGGTGLGLSITDELARLMDGRIEVTSAPGRGSTFTFVVPLARHCSHEAGGTEPAQPVSPRSLRNGLVVLVAEDDPASLTVVTAMLQALQAIPVTAQTGEQALALLESQAFDAVLMDVQLPLLDGHEVTRHWRAREAGAPATRLPIVAMTGNATDDDARRCIASGMDAVLVKPFGMADLRARLLAVAETR